MPVTKFLNIEGKLIDLTEPKVMGVLNVTPDSFYPGSRVKSIDEAISLASMMVNEGATFLDMGGYSSRPGAVRVPEEEEIRRVVEPIREIRRAIPEAIISIDTFRSGVAVAALEAGAHLINDISGGQLDKEMLTVVARYRVPYIGMHMRGTPQNMTNHTSYDNIVLEVTRYFSEMNEKCISLGINDLIIDPGFGFAKETDQNFELLAGLDHLKFLERPILVGVSRKSMIYKTLKISPDQAQNGTTVLNTLALSKGANILRVHDITPAIEAVKLTQKLN